MDDAALRELIERSRRADLARLLAAKEKAAGILRENPTARNSAAYDRASRALEHKCKELEKKEAAQETAPQVLRRPADVLRFIMERCEGASRTTVFRHASEGLIPRTKAGDFVEAGVLQYVEAQVKAGRLRWKEGGGPEAKEAAGLQVKKLEKAIALQDLEERERRIKLERLEGRLISREEAALDLAARAGALDARLRHMVRARVMDWVALVEGKPAKAQDLRHEIELALDDLLADYARQGEFVAEFAEEAGAESPAKDA